MIVPPYIGFKRSTEQSAAIDVAVDKFLLMDEKLTTLGKVTQEPSAYDVEPTDLPLIVQERDRLREITAALRNDIEACVYPANPSATPSECDKIKTYPMPPTHAMGDGIPDRFSSDCRTTELAIPPMEFGKNGNRLRSDGRIGGRMLIEFEIEPIVADGRMIRVRVTQRATEPGTSKNSAEEDIIEFYEEAVVHRPSGCVVVGVPTKIAVPAKWFNHNQPQSYDAYLDVATCRSNARGATGGGFRARSYDAFVCNVSFLPLRGVSLTNEELFENDNVRPRASFKKLGWLMI